MRVAVGVAVLAACSGKKSENQPLPGHPLDAVTDGVVADGATDSGSAADWKPRCKTALVAAAKAPIARRPREIIDGCKPCGDWSALLRWDIRGEDGGPTRDAIEQAMERCEAYCSTAAKQRFLGTLDDARGKSVRTPWRFLGELCGDAVSAKPDPRFMSAPYFALDRIARAAAMDTELAKQLADIELPLPAVSTSGDGLAISLAPVTKPETGRFQITVAAGAMQHVGSLPIARLTGAGVIVDHRGEPYPGTQVATKDLKAAIAKLVDKDTSPITIVAPTGLSARRIADVVVGTNHYVLGAEVRAAPHGWSLLGHVPVALQSGDTPDENRRPTIVLVVTDAKSVDVAIEKLKTATPAQLAVPVISIAKGTATVNDLTKLVGALAYRDVKLALLGAK